MSRRRKKKRRGSASRVRQQRRDDLALLVKRANRALDGADFDRAWITWQGIARRFAQQRDLADRGLAETLLRRATIQLKGEERAESLQEAVDLLPDEARLRYHLAMALHKCGKPKQALVHYERAHELGFDDQRLGYPWALAAVQAGDRRQTALALPLVTDPDQQAALTAVDLLRRKKPGDMSALKQGDDRLQQLWIGLAHLARGEHEAAVSVLEAASPPASLRRPDAIETVRRYYLGVLAAVSGDLETAESHWRLVQASVRRRPLSSNVLKSVNRNLGILYRNRAIGALEDERFAEALELAQEGLQLTPGERILAETGSLAGFHLGNQAAEAGDWQQAMAYWQAAYDISPNRHLALNLGLAHERREQWEEAAGFWRDMARRRPRKANHPNYLSEQQVAAVWARAASCYARAGDVDNSIAAYRNAIKQDPQNVDLRLQLAQAQWAAGSDTAALNTARRATQIDPDSTVALNLLAAIHAARGERYAAVRCWEQVVKLDPEDVDARRELAQYYETLGDRAMSWGDPADALEWYNKGLAADPDNAILLGSIALLKASQDDAAAAIDYAHRTVANAGTNSEPYLFAARAMIEIGEADLALEMAQTARSRMPALSPSFYLQLAVNALDEENQALFDQFERLARELAEEDFEFYMSAGAMFVTAERFDLAETYLQRAVELDENMGQARLLLGIVYARTNRMKQAKAEWRKAKRLARKAHDDELLDGIKAAEVIYGSRGPLGFLDVMLRMVAEEEGLDYDDIFPYHR